MLPLLAGAAAAALFSIQGSLLYDADEVMPVGPADAGLPEMKAIDSLTKDMTFCESCYAPAQLGRPTVPAISGMRVRAPGFCWIWVSACYFKAIGNEHHQSIETLTRTTLVRAQSWA
jgi:hypothetical protein